VEYPLEIQQESFTVSMANSSIVPLLCIVTYKASSISHFHWSCTLWTVLERLLVRIRAIMLIDFPLRIYSTSQMRMSNCLTILSLTCIPSASRLQYEVSVTEPHSGLVMLGDWLVVNIQPAYLISEWLKITSSIIEMHLLRVQVFPECMSGNTAELCFV
jgi:hypothetical protein